MVCCECIWLCVCMSVIFMRACLADWLGVSHFPTCLCSHLWAQQQQAEEPYEPWVLGE